LIFRSRDVRVLNVFALLSPGESQWSTTLRVPIRTTDRVLLQARFKITRAADVERVVGATKNVDPRHPVILLICPSNRQDHGRRLWTSRVWIFPSSSALRQAHGTDPWAQGTLRGGPSTGSGHISTGLRAHTDGLSAQACWCPSTGSGHISTGLRADTAHGANRNSTTSPSAMT
jgi:hypothetical protein